MDKDVPKAWRTLAKGLCANSSLWCHWVFHTRQAHFTMGWSEPGYYGRQTWISWLGQKTHRKQLRRAGKVAHIEALPAA